ncbi:MAG TPA: hypothetical protein VMU20_00795 [Candidatus Dormibacteraeota bacterium]|jgi:hypothetical protein|nr:hypothetical protein [Candidatus Dormibacteraeota bacterium]
MLSDAVREMVRAARADECARARRLEARADLGRAEGYAAEVEEIVALERSTVPATLLTEIRRFIRRHSRRMARSLGAEPAPSRVLDALFDVQERIQARMSAAMERAA